MGNLWRRSAGSALFTFASGAGYYAEYDASALSTTSALSIWPDVGGHYSASQGTGTAQPPVVAAAQNGLNGVSMSGAHYLDATTFGLSGDPSVTAYLVCKPSILTSYHCPFGWGNISTSNAWSLLFNNTNPLQASSTNNSQFTASLTSTTQIYCVQKSPGPQNTNTFLYRNAVSQALQSSTTTTPTVGTNGLRIGGFTPAYAGYGWNGYLFHLVVYNAFHDATTMANVTTKLNTKWAVY